MSLSREFLHPLVELVLFELVLGVPNVSLGHGVRIDGLRDFAVLTKQSVRLSG